MDKLDVFLVTFNDRYPFERYILKEPKSINYLFDDLVLTEIFVPSTELNKEYIKEGLFDHGENYIKFDDVFIKVKGKGIEFRLALSDFSYSVIDGVIGYVLDDMGPAEWEALYVEYENSEDYNDVIKMLKVQKDLIEKKYGECKIKDNFNSEVIPDLVKKLK